MKVFYPTDKNKSGVIITSSLGTIEGSDLLHYRAAVLLVKSGKVISDTFEPEYPEGRTIEVNLVEEEFQIDQNMIDAQHEEIGQRKPILHK